MGRFEEAVPVLEALAPPEGKLGHRQVQNKIDLFFNTFSIFFELSLITPSSVFFSISSISFSIYFIWDFWEI